MSEQLPEGFRRGLSGELYEEFGHYLGRIPVIDRTDPEHPVVIPPGDPLAKEVEDRNNVKAMREALLKASDVLTEAAHHNLTEEYINECLTLIHAALTKPACNGEVGTAEEQAERYFKFCLAQRHHCDKCPAFCRVQYGCKFAWAQMLYKESEENNESKVAEVLEDEPMPVADKCPWCGNGPKLIHPTFDGGTYVECPTIGCRGYGNQVETWAETDRGAIIRWNEFVKKATSKD